MRLFALALLVVACAPPPEPPPRLATVEIEPPMPEYNRSDWGRWSDDDGDCQDTRQEVLIAESIEPVVFEDERKCRVQSGHWVDPYTGERITDPSKLDIDHMVPLHEAHLSGGHAWDAAKKKAYFNDLAYPEHLVAVTASANRSKGDRQPHEWMPPAQIPAVYCTYIHDWIRIKTRWELAYDQAEALGLVDLQGKHCR